MLNAIYTCASHASLVPVLSLDALEELAPGSGVEFVNEHHPTEDALATLLYEETLVELSQFVISLSPRLRDIVRRHYWQEQSQVEIAEALGVTRSAICHALAKIADLGRQYFGIAKH
jgi:DNA-directed RNA polymerase specialized sigma24 family protein